MWVIIIGAIVLSVLLGSVCVKAGKAIYRKREIERDPFNVPFGEAAAFSEPFGVFSGQATEDSFIYAESRRKETVRRQHHEAASSAGRHSSEKAIEVLVSAASRGTIRGVAPSRTEIHARTSRQASAMPSTPAQAPIQAQTQAPQSFSSQETVRIPLARVRSLPEIVLAPADPPQDSCVERLRIPDAEEVMATMVRPQDLFLMMADPQENLLIHDECQETFEEPQKSKAALPLQETTRISGSVHLKEESTISSYGGVAGGVNAPEIKRELSFIFHFEQARLLSEWGEEALAADLFWESGSLAQNEQDKEKALFDALLCYAKCDDLIGIISCVSLLEDMPALSFFEQNRLRAIRAALTRMLDHGMEEMPV